MVWDTGLIQINDNTPGMRLITKFTLLYIIITGFVIALGSVIVFREIINRVDNEAYIKLNSWIRGTVDQLKEGVPLEDLQIHTDITVEELDFEQPLIAHYEIDSVGIFPPRRRGDDRRLIIGESFKIGNRHYLVKAHSFIAEPDEIQEGLEKSLYITFLILLAIVVVISFFISNRILLPFNKSLQAMSTFNIKNQLPIKLKQPRTREFKKLNEFLEKMTTKAVNDYKSLKEFTENASHEIQTPLAIIRGKLELMMETNIDENQAEYINSIQNAVNKLSAVNHTLVLLTKLDNQEYASEEINFSKYVKDGIWDFQELIEMHSIKLRQDIKEGVLLNLNPFLAEILMNNLLSNAVKHNIPDGYINVVLTNSELRIENSGEPLQVPVEDLFKRFKKNKQSSSSTGLGLAIVKQICDMQDMNIDYINEEEKHIIRVHF